MEAAAEAELDERISSSLHSWPSVGTHDERLSSLKSRIEQQKGSFQNITEASLEEEVGGAGQDVVQLGHVDSVEDDKASDERPPRELAQGARAEILKQIA
jgi:hypothetical protein